jgi:hypothetical protein
MRSRRRRWIALLAVPIVGAAALFVVRSAEAAAALTVEGVYYRVTVDGVASSAGEPETVSSGQGATAKVAASVQVGSTRVPVPDQPSIASGASVQMTLAAPAGYTATKAVAVLAWRADSAVTVTGIKMVTRRYATTVVGDHTLTVLPVYWGDSTDGATVDMLRTMGQQTQEFWREQSNNGVNIKTVTVKDWKKIDAPAAACDLYPISNAAVAANGLPAATGSNHYVIYFPTRNECGAYAFAEVGGALLWVNGYWNPDFQLLGMVPHESGHNLGIMHAHTMTCDDNGVRVPMPTSTGTKCTFNEYGDKASTVGGGLDANPPAGNLDVAAASHLGFAQIASVIPGTALTATLSPIGDSASGKTRGVRIPLSDGSELYVELRPNTGRDTRMPGWAGVQVRRWVPDPVYGTSSTDLLDMQPNEPAAFTHPNMPAGASYRVPNENFIIKVLDASDTSATISVLPVTSASSSGHRIVGMDGKCIGLAYGNTISKTPVDVYSCNDSATQYWDVSDGGTIHNSALCLDIADGRTDDGAPVQVYSCNDSDAQHWDYTSDHQLMNPKAKKCLDMKDNTSADFTRLQIWSCNGNGNQRWTINA